MKKYARVFTYLGRHKSSITWYFISILLSIVFSILSIGMLLPFMQLIFGVESGGITKPSTNPLVQYVNEQLGSLISNGSVYHALGIVCVLIICSIFLKNLFLYLSYRAMGPVKNSIVNQFRVDLYNKVLRFPLAILLNNVKEI